MVDKSRQFYNRSKKLWLQDNTREMYSAFNEGKYVITERFTRTLKDHSATEMKPVDVKSLTLVKKLTIKS